MIKRIKGALLLASCSLLLACGAPDVKELEDGDKFAVVGSDLVVGTGSKDNINFPQEMGVFIGTWVVNKGKVGETSDGALQRIDEIFANDMPSHLMIVVGDEDMKRGVADDVIVSNISKMIEKARGINVIPIVVGLPRPAQVNSKLKLIDAPFYKSVANQHNVVYIDEVFSEVLDKKEFKSNTNFLVSEGYVEVAKKISLKMRDLGFIKEVKFEK